MCDPVSLAIGSSVVGAFGTREAAKAQIEGLSTQRNAQSEEISDRDSARAGERVKQGRAERARLRVAGGEAGVTGNSFEAQLLDSILQEDLDIGTISKDSANTQRASEARFRSGLASVNNPTLLDAGLQIAGAGFGASRKEKDRLLKIGETA